MTVPTGPAPSTTEPSAASESTTTTQDTAPTPDTAPTDTAIAPPEEITAPDLVPPRPVWAAYLAVADETDPTAKADLVAAGDRAEAAGHTSHTFPLACQGTAAETLSVPPYLVATAVLFDSEADARRFADTYSEPVVDVVHVVEYWCYAAVQ